MKKHKGATSPISPRAIRAAERAGRAVELKLAGHTLAEIAGQVGLGSRASAYRAIMRGMRALGKPEDVELLRDLQRARLEELLKALWPRAIGDEETEPDLKAVDRILKIMARQAKLDGLDAPVKVAQTDAHGHNLTVEEARRDLMQIAAQLRRRIPHPAGGPAATEGPGRPLVPQDTAAERSDAVQS